MLKYKKYKLIKLTKKVEGQILQLIDKNNGSIFHEPLLNEIISEKFNTDFYYFVDKPENIKHAAVVHVTKNKIGFKKYNLRPLSDIPYSGFIGDEKIVFNEFSIGITESLSYVGFPYFKNIPPTHTLGETAMVDLKLSQDNIFDHVIHSKRRNMIRKAMKSGLLVKKYNSMEGLDIFWPILSELHNNLNYNQLDYNYYESILETYFDNDKAFVLLAFKDDEPISGVIIIGNQNYMHYYKGASKMDVKNEGHGELLQWEAIKYSKHLGAKYYDLCNLSKDKLPHIYRFKTGISNNIYNYQMYNHNSFLYKAANRLVKLI